MEIRLTKRDIEIIFDCLDFGPLSQFALMARYFGCKTDGQKKYGQKRIKQIENEELLKKRMISEHENKTSIRRGDVCFCTSAGAKVVEAYYRKHKEGRRVRFFDKRRHDPDKELYENKLDVRIIISEIYRQTPDLISRIALLQQEEEIPQFRAFECAIPGENHYTFIHVLGKNCLTKNTNKNSNDKSLDVGRINNRVEFINSKFTNSPKVNNSKHVFLSRTFNPMLLTPGSYYIRLENILLDKDLTKEEDKIKKYPLFIATQIIKRLATDPKCHQFYHKKLAEKISAFCPVEVLPYYDDSSKEEFFTLKTPIGEFPAGELITGSNNLRARLKSPPKNVLIYALTSSDLQNTPLAEGESYHVLYPSMDSTKIEEHKGELIFSKPTHPLLKMISEKK